MLVGRAALCLLADSLAASNYRETEKLPCCLSPFKFAQEFRTAVFSHYTAVSLNSTREKAVALRSMSPTTNLNELLAYYFSTEHNTVVVKGQLNVM